MQSFVAGWEELRGRVAPNQNLNENEIDRLVVHHSGSRRGYIYDDSDAERLQNEIVLIDAKSRRADDRRAATRMVPLSTARRNLETRILNLQGWNSQQKVCPRVSVIAADRPNVLLDQPATTNARETAAARSRRSSFH